MDIKGTIMIQYRNLTTEEEIRALHAEYAHTINVLKDAGLLPESEIHELDALLGYITIRLKNLRESLKD